MILQTSLVFGQFESTANACCISFNPFGRQTLMSQGFIEQDRSTRLYFLGVEFLALGAKSANRRDIQSLARGSLATLAKLSGDTVYLVLPAATQEGGELDDSQLEKVSGGLADKANCKATLSSIINISAG